ncbi:MAG: hypothetical protein E7167_01665 [Firmicutes bacterium]|nr:hypothetical protein [Bacillota bacterium]
MAKVSFTKLGLVKNSDVSIVEWNDQKIEVKDYLPMSEKLDLVSTVINNSIDNNGYYNPMRVYIYTIIEVILAYTNISVTEKQKEDIAKLYDLFVSSGLSGKIIGETINPYEYQQIQKWIYETINAIYSYKNSVMGILDTVSEDYSNLKLDAESIHEKLADPEQLTLLKDVLTKLG